MSQCPSLSLHQKIRLVENTPRCRKCGKAVIQRSSLLLHRKTHNGKKICECSKRAGGFSKRSVLVHKRIHNGEKTHESKKALNQQGSHLLENLYKCRKSFNRISSIMLHQRIHAAEKPYIRDKCQKVFRWLSTLILHLKIHNGEKLYRCNKCEKDCNQHSSLMQHQKVHTRKKKLNVRNVGRCFLKLLTLKFIRTFILKRNLSNAINVVK